MCVLPPSDLNGQAAAAWSALRRGGVALVPFDVAYALTAHTPAGVDRIFALKGRAREKRCVVLGNPAIFNELAVPRNHARARFSHPVGLITRARTASPLWAQIPDSVRVGDTLAIFLTMGPLGDALAQAGLDDGALVFGSSANRSLSGNHFAFSDVEPEIRDQVDVAINAGRTRYAALDRHGRGVGSTILDLERDVVVRAGLACTELVAEARAMGLRMANHP